MSAEEETTRVPAPPGQDELPYDDGEPMETWRHWQQMTLLVATLDDAWRDHRDDYFVGGNMFVYFSELQARSNDFRGPDVYVVLGTKRRKSRKSWVVWEEDGRLPNVVVELLSKSTEAIDRGDKMRIYARVWRLPEYYLYDPIDHRLEGYALDVVRGEYVPIEPDARGDLPVRQLGLSLGLRDRCFPGEDDPWLRWIDADGRVLPTGDELAREAKARVEQARERVEQAHERAEQAHERAEQAHERAEQEHERAEQERERAEQEHERAEQERERAEQERERADAAERRLAALQAELARRGERE